MGGHASSLVTEPMHQNKPLKLANAAQVNCIIELVLGDLVTIVILRRAIVITLQREI